MKPWLARIKEAWPWRSRQQGPLLVEHGGPDQLDRPLATAAVDVLENDSELLVIADVPGGHEDNTKIYWDAQRGLQLYVQRSPAGPATHDGGAMADWYRAFQLPGYLLPHDARSSVSSGVLRISIPRKPDAKPVSIPVRAGT